MLAESYPYYLANRPVWPNRDLAVTNKYTGEVATHVALADNAAIDAAIEQSVAAVDPLREMAPYQRQDVLMHCVKRFTERFDELAMSLCIEAGKPLKDSRREVSRLMSELVLPSNAMKNALRVRHNRMRKVRSVRPVENDKYERR